ncbi:hypothetical protein ACHAXS_005736 [Conticribra weissflogii]
MKLPFLVLTAAGGASCLVLPLPLCSRSRSRSFSHNRNHIHNRNRLSAGLRDFVSDPRDDEANNNGYDSGSYRNSPGQVPFGRPPLRLPQSPLPNGGTFGGFGQSLQNRQADGNPSGNNGGFYGAAVSQQQQSQRQFQQQRAGSVNFGGSGGGYGGSSGSGRGVPYLSGTSGTNSIYNGNFNSNNFNPNNFNSPASPNVRSANTLDSSAFAATSSRPTFSIPRQGAGTFPLRGAYPQYNFDGDNFSGSVFSRPSNYINPSTRETARDTFSDSRATANINNIGNINGSSDGASRTAGGTRGIPSSSSSSSNLNLGLNANVNVNVNQNLSNNVVERYFQAWNARNIPLALSCFAPSVYYDDTQFSTPFEGKEALAKHLFYVADCLPDSFRFVLDGLAVGPAGREREITTNTVKAGNAPPGRYGGGFGNASTRRNNNVVQIGALWHVENDNGPVPFARGCSFYKVDPSSNLIVEGYDFPEPAVVKGGAFGLRVLSIASKLIDEPVRFVPFVLWIGYIYVVFFSDGILPGKNALALEQRMWEEVRNLSLNFFYVAPLLKLKFSPVVHPMLEGVFNGLLAWAAMFAGFLSDDRSGDGGINNFNNSFNNNNNNNRRGRTNSYYQRMMENQQMTLPDGTPVLPSVSTTKRNLFSMLPAVIGMQFLTSAFLLPYLFARTSERVAPDGIVTRPLFREELDFPARIVGESKALGVVMGHVGVFSIYWFLAGRIDKFGPPLWESTKRMDSFAKLLSVDRVGSSFLVDLVIFALFQGWLIDDDWRRRGRSMEEDKILRSFAKFVPFWGLALYLCFRPEMPSYDEFERDSSKYLRGGRFYGNEGGRNGRGRGDGNDRGNGGMMGGGFFGRGNDRRW